MEVKRSSWHFMLNDLIYKNPEKFNTLCSYFWRTVFSVFITIIVLSVILFMFLIYGMAISDWYFDYSTSIVNSNLIIRRAIQIPIGLIGIIISFFLIKYFVIGWVKAVVFCKNLCNFIKKLLTRSLKNLKKPNIPSKKEPSLIIEIIKAKKKKYCPTIEFKGKR
jgi:hypothetical protein